MLYGCDQHIQCSLAPGHWHLLCHTCLCDTATLQLPDPSRSLCVLLIPSLWPWLSHPEVLGALGDHLWPVLWCPGTRVASPGGLLPLLLSPSLSMYLSKKPKPWLFKEYYCHCQKKKIHLEIQMTFLPFLYRGCRPAKKIG